MDARTVEGTDKQVYEQIIAEYGPDSSQAHVEVYGQFPNANDDQFISASTVDEAMVRDRYKDQSAPIVIGVDPARFGADSTVIAVRQGRDIIALRKHKGDDRLEIRLAEVLSDVTHAMDEDAARLEKDGVERDLQELLADAPGWCGDGFRLVRREWPTDIGPVDLMCRDGDDGWVAVEIKRVGTIDAVEQLARYLERIRLDPALADCCGVLAAQVVKPQARVLAEARGLAWVEVDLAELRGEREPALTLFGA